MIKKKGVCKVCGGVYQLRKDGKLRSHAQSVKWGWSSCNGGSTMPEKVFEAESPEPPVTADDR